MSVLAVPRSTAMSRPKASGLFAGTGLPLSMVSTGRDDRSSVAPDLHDGYGAPRAGATARLQLREEELEFPDGRLGAVAAVYQVLGVLHAQVAPDGAGIRSARVRGAHHRPDHLPRLLGPFDSDRHDRTP